MKFNLLNIFQSKEQELNRVQQNVKSAFDPVAQFLGRWFGASDPVNTDSEQTLENKTLVDPTFSGNMTGSIGNLVATNIKDSTRACARVSGCAAQTGPNSTTVVVAYLTVNYDPRGCISGAGTTSFRFTAPEAGIYLVTASIGMPTTGVRADVWLYLHKNGSASESSLLDFENGPLSTSYEVLNGTGTIRLAAGDCIDIRARQSQASGTAARTIDSSVNTTYVNIVRLLTDL